jgi:hypothetical protein
MTRTAPDHAGSDMSRPVASHQTVRLSAGGHSHAGAGMCVMELASVLAGEAFNAYPESVCPVTAMFLRYYNDLLDDRRRQELIPYAAHIVGTRADSRTEARRARMCRRWVARIARPGLRHRPVWTLLGLRRGQRNDAAAAYAALVAAASPDYHDPALRLLDRLIAKPASAKSRDTRGSTTSPPMSRTRVPSARVLR